MSKFKKGTKIALPAEPRSADEINREYTAKCFLAGNNQYQIAMLTEELERLNEELRELNNEGHARKKLDEAAAKAEVKAD